VKFIEAIVSRFSSLYSYTLFMWM